MSHNWYVCPGPAAVWPCSAPFKLLLLAVNLTCTGVNLMLPACCFACPGISTFTISVRGFFQISPLVSSDAACASAPHACRLHVSCTAECTVWRMLTYSVKPGYLARSQSTSNFTILTSDSLRIARPIPLISVLSTSHRRRLLILQRLKLNSTCASRACRLDSL